MWEDLAPTADDTVRIEEIWPAYVRYQAKDGRRWEVQGFCEKRGYCLVGAVIRVGDDLVEIESLEHIEVLKQELGVERIDSELDVPVGPGFEGCCPFEITVLGE